MNGQLRISGLFRYPVKSCGGESLSQARLDALGIEGDRRWMLVDAHNRFMSQRNWPRMAVIQARWHKDRLILEYRCDRLVVTTADLTSTVLSCRVWNDLVPGVLARDAVNRRLAHWLGCNCRLVRLAPHADRQVDMAYAPVGVYTGFADGFPVLLLSQSSLDKLNRLSDGCFDARHFRPNILVSGCLPHAEDQWRRLQAGDVTVHLVKPCSRCVIPTVDPNNGVFQGPEPLRTLAAYRRYGKKIYFGQNAWVQWPASLIEQPRLPVLAVGQPLDVLERKDAVIEPGKA